MSRSFLAFSLSQLLLLLLITGCPGGNSTPKPPPPIATGAIRGTVFVNERNQLTTVNSRAVRPVSGALVRIHGTALSAVSDAGGAFLLGNIPVGTQTVVISAAGYQTTSQQVTILKDTTLNLSSTTLQPAPRKWTILVYMNADNDLEEYGVQDVNEMESVPDNDEVSIAVMMDRTPGFDSSNGDWTGTKRFLIRHDDDMAIMNSTLSSPVLEDMGEIDMGQPQTLRDFIAWGKSTFPAEHYAVIIWNHGSGWRTRSVDNAITRGVSFDDTSGSYIRTTDLPSALQTAPPLDMVCFDASLMQMLEIAYEMRKSCDIIVGSEESPPGAGYPYHRWLTPLAINPGMTPAELATVICRETLTYYGQSSNITHSAIDTAKIPQIARALDAFAASLISVAGARKSQLASARDAAESFGSSYYPDYKDLVHYAELVKARVSDAAVRGSADALIAAVQASMIAEYHGNQHPNANGVSIYIPTRSNFQRFVSQYRGLALASDTRWDEWLAAQQQ